MFHRHSAALRRYSHSLLDVYVSHQPKVITREGIEYQQYRFFSQQSVAQQKHLNVLYTSLRWPQPSATAAGSRTLHIVDAVRRILSSNFQRLGNGESQQLRIAFATPQSPSSSHSREVLSIFSKNNEQNMIRLVQLDPNDHRYGMGDVTSSSASDPKLEQIFDGEAADLVIFDTFIAEEYYGWRVATQWPEAVRVLDTQDLHSLRLHRQQLVENWISENQSTGKAYELDNKLINVIKSAVPPSDLSMKAAMNCNASRFSSLVPDWQRERASLARCDLNLMISSHEMDLLQHQMNIDAQIQKSLMYYPFVVPQMPNSVAGGWRRKDFAMIGSFRHAPNRDSILVAKYHWAQIRKQLPDAVLHVWGSFPRQDFIEMSHPRIGFLVHGPMKELSALQKYRVQLAPLRFGAGLKGKILDSWYHGLPVVTTSIGAEGMKQDNSVFGGGNVVDSATEFVDAAVKLYQDDELWSQNFISGHDSIRMLFGSEHDEALARRLLPLLQREQGSQRREMLMELRSKMDYQLADSIRNKSIEIARKIQARAQQKAVAEKEG